MGTDSSAGWAGATWTVAGVGGLYSATIISISAATDGSVVQTLTWSMIIGFGVLLAGYLAYRYSATSVRRRCGASIALAVCVVAGVYGLSVVF